MPHLTLPTTLVLAALVSTLSALGGCCGTEQRVATRYGGGTVSMELDSADGELGIEATGTAAGSDPESSTFAGAGGYVERDRADTQRGTACVTLDREPDARCGGETLCVRWEHSGDGGFVTATLDDTQGGSRVGITDDTSTAFTDDGPAAGSLTVHRMEWDDGDDDCGINALSVDWAFDEADPYEVMEKLMCL